MNGIQLEMNFDGPRGNRFREKLNNGVFQVLIEVTPPAESMPIEDAVARYADIEYIVSSHSDLSAVLAFTDTSAEPENGMDTVRFASALCKMDRDKHLLCISGRSRTQLEIDKILGHAVAEGFRNVLALSGDTLPQDTEKTVRDRRYTESVHILQNINEHFSSCLNAGCAVNPYCYIPETSFPQYFKLIKKIGQGASFIVTQFGWDMRKLQELRWFLSSRNAPLPTIARFLLLNPERAKKICNGAISGIHISPDLAEMLRMEMSHSAEYFEAAQWRRIQLHAAGSRFLGYSGIQIAGADRPDQVKTLLSRIAEAMQEFKTFEDWLCAYNDYYERLEMAPYPFRFYEFDDLLKTAHVPDQPVFTQSDVQPPSSADQLRYKMASKLFSQADRLPAEEKRLTKKMLVSCHFCKVCRLPQLHFICPEECPKGFANGPCGSAGVDGMCEFGQHECIHVRRMRLAYWLNDCASMEEFIPSAEERYSE